MKWEDFLKDTGVLGDNINEKGFKPDIIIAIARGGWIPARILSDCLKVKNMGSIGIKYLDTDRTTLETYSKPTLPQDCKKILLVEDMLESGNSIKWAKDYYSEIGYQVKTACLFIMETTVFKPDYYLSVSEKVQFPWEQNNEG